jgi:hypothetical protein
MRGGPPVALLRHRLLPQPDGFDASRTISAREPADQPTKHRPDFGCEGNVGGQADDDAERQPNHRTNDGRDAFASRARAITTALVGQRGQGTLEYVGLILLVSLLMVGMVWRAI